jgi:uncharacterized protein YndB with AHSA1/START domain
MVLIYVGAGFLVMLGVILAAMSLAGRRLPEEHRAIVEADVPAHAERVWGLIADWSAYPQWVRGVSKVEPVGDAGEAGAGRKGTAATGTSFRQRMGRQWVVVRVELAEPPRRLVQVIRDERGPFSGRWEFIIEPRGEGCRLLMTETGRVRSPVARFMMTHLIGYDYFMKKFIGALRNRLVRPGAEA